jgi:hypothetical protein
MALSARRTAGSLALSLQSVHLARHGVVGARGVITEAFVSPWQRHFRRKMVL